MKFLPYLLKHLRRNWVRTGSTVFAMSVCVFLFCTLRTVIEAVNWGLQSANASRLVARHGLSLANNLPLTHRDKIAAVPGVKSVAITSWFGGSLAAKRADESSPASQGSSGPDFSNFFANFAVDADAYFPMYPEYLIPEDQKRSFLQDMRGCIVGRGLADRFGWKVGDSFFLESFIPPYRRRSGPFEFVVQGIYDTDLVRYPGTDARLMFFHHKYLYEGTNRRVGAGTFAIEIADPAQAGRISREIDTLFENSDAPSKTETEAAFAASFISMAGNLAFLLNGIGLAVAFTILLVTANTMSMAVRERRTEIAVLKTLGFSSALVMALILGEAILLGALGGGVGIALSRGMIGILPDIPFIGDAVRAFPNLGLSPKVGGQGFAIALFLGLAAGFVPAFLAYRARITEMLRQA